MAVFQDPNMIDEHTRAFLALKVRTHFNAQHVVEDLADLCLNIELICNIRSR